MDRLIYEQANQCAAANRRPAGQLDGAGNLLAIVAADRAFPAAVAELGRSAKSAMRRMLLISVVAFVVAIVGCGDRPSPAVSRDSVDRPSSDRITLDGAYGSLVYEGVVERSIEEDVYKYTIENLSLRYSVFSRLNITKKIQVSVVLVATQRPPSGQGSWKRIFKEIHETGALLTFTSPKTAISNLVFTIPREIVQQADHVGLSVTDGRLLWPIGGELKAELDGAANRSQPIRAETNPTSVAAGSDR